MASGSRDSPPMEEDELKADGKKRKFKPFEAVRKLFGKGKRKAKDDPVSVVAVKAKSTTALQLRHDDDEDDDDGGFKSRQPRPLGGNRSISEDSVFSPEQRDNTNLQALKKTAVSEERLPKSAFQAELFSKLSKRRSQHSDEDDGLPHSPTPPVTTADIIMGGPLKPLPAAGKSTSRESDNSLISMDGSENEEDDPFRSQWKSSVPSKVSKSPKEPGGVEGSLDFDKMAHTELLKSDVAKDRISVKPRTRKASRQSRKKRDGQSPLSLPSLNEESPTKAHGEGTAQGTVSDSETVQVTAPSDEPKELPTEKPSGAASGQQPLTKLPSDSASSQQNAKSAPLSMDSPAKPIAAMQPAKQDIKRSSLKSETPPASKDSTVTKVSTDAKDSNVSKMSFEAKDSNVARVSLDAKDMSSVTKAPLEAKDSSAGKVSFDARKPETVNDSGLKTAPSKVVEFVKKGSHSESPRGLSSPTSSAAGGGPSGASKTDATAEASSSSSGTKPKVEFLSSSVRSSGSRESDVSVKRSSLPDMDSMASTQITFSNTTVNAPSAAGSASSTVTSAPPPSTPSSSAAPASSPTASKKESLRPTDGQTAAAYSPKDDYKLRRQNRSKTLPEQPISKDEQFATKVQRAASHRVEATSSQNASPETSPRHKEKVVESAKSKEPEWFALARKKTGRQESEEKSDSPSPTREAVPVKGPASAASDPPSASGATPAAKAEPTSTAVDRASNMSVSSASSKFEQFRETKQGEVSRVRGGSVKTSPTKTNILSNRGGSVKIITSARSELVGSSAASASPSFLKTSSASSAAPSSSLSTPAARLEEKKEEAKSSDSSPTRDIPKWKMQSAKAASALSPGTPATTTTTTTSAASASRFASVKVFAHPATPSAVSGTKAEHKVTSPVKRPPLSKGSSEEEKVSVPAWRANLTPKKPVQSDIKIELIESPSNSSSSSLRSSKKEEAAKRQESPTKTPAAAASTKDLPSDQCRGSATSTQTSKVMNLLKNFENLQGVS